jgi:hypothetical protein
MTTADADHRVEFAALRDALRRQRHFKRAHRNRRNADHRNARTSAARFFALASIGNRFLAVAIDHFIQYLTIFIVAWAFEYFGRIGDVKKTAARIVFSGNAEMDDRHFDNRFVSDFFRLFHFFEWLWNGQTPGKSLLKLRVIREDGRPITLWEAMARNLAANFRRRAGFRRADLFNRADFDFSERPRPAHRRYVCRHGRYPRAHDEAPTLPKLFPIRSATPLFGACRKRTDFQADVNQAFNESEIEVVESFLRRRWDLTERQRLWMAWRVALPMMYKLKPNYDLQTFTYEGFLEELVHRFHSRQRFLN